MKGVKLTTRQKNALRVINWYISDGNRIRGNPEGRTNRRTGRTFLLAYAYLRLAKRYPNTYIYIVDFGAAAPYDEYNFKSIMDSIKYIWSLVRDERPYQKFDLEFNIRERCVRLVL